ncbi:hypothetical protein LMJ38_23860 [Streptomyces sp. R1]|uniref:hypothetical protein n=1 Tax=Streptomyces sp. R1 TaxID=1509279 RepID=UPI001E5C5083|nr:hypothetical protein [Streptomyces sp. R1]MCC8338959.1 hypothetical protein [Streptomyces sp. R1]
MKAESAGWKHRSADIPDAPESTAAGRSTGPERPQGTGPGKSLPRRKQVLLRLHPQLYDALARWAGDELRSTNAQIEFLLRIALAEAGRHPSGPRPVPREQGGRPFEGEPTVLRRRTG